MGFHSEWRPNTRNYYFLLLCSFDVLIKLWARGTNAEDEFLFFKSEIRHIVHRVVLNQWSIDSYLFHSRVVLSGRWVRLWEAAGFLDDILSLPGPSALLDQSSFLNSRIGRYICLRILSHCWHSTLCVCVFSLLLSLRWPFWVLHFQGEDICARSTPRVPAVRTLW